MAVVCFSFSISNLWNGLLREQYSTYPKKLGGTPDLVPDRKPVGRGSVCNLDIAHRWRLPEAGAFPLAEESPSSLIFLAGRSLPSPEKRLRSG